MKDFFSAIAGVCLGSLLLFGSYSGYAQEQKDPISFKIMGMAPTLVSNPVVPNWEGAVEWDGVRSAFEAGNAEGIHTIPTDTFWGLVHICAGREPRCFNWKYIEKMFDLIIAQKGNKIAPKMSIHQLGGNVNDPGATYILLPQFILEKMEKKSLGYLSELGNWNREAVSPWDLDELLPDIEDFWAGFNEHFTQWFKDKGLNIADYIDHLIIGMGPAGELVYPAYHAHDRARPATDRVIDEAKFPGRGILQHCSPRAIASLQKYLQKLKKKDGSLKYPDITELNRVWGKSFPSFDKIKVLCEPQEVDEFFANQMQYSEMGQDFFDWYHGSLIRAGKRLAGAATSQFHSEGSELKNTPLSFKVGGTHWQWAQRIPMLTAGLTTTRGAKKQEGLNVLDWAPDHWDKSRGAGLESIFSDLLLPLRKEFPASKWIPTFTCADIPSCNSNCLNPSHHEFHGCVNCPLGFRARSGSQALVEAFLDQADRHGFWAIIENALEGSVEDLAALHRIVDLSTKHKNVLGVSFLRLQSAMRSKVFRQIIDPLKAIPSRELSTSKNRCSDELLVIPPHDGETPNIRAQIRVPA